MSDPRDIEKEPSVIAADPNHSAWVAANAGAGKTYTLANRVTRLLLAETDPGRILCLTYTKAAAAEMQARLFKQLGEWSMLPNAELERKVIAIGAGLGGPEDMKKARRLFAKALETPGGLKILTIHAFCQNVLSRFPLEAGVPAAFDVLDEQTTRELIAQARSRVLERSGSGDAPRAAALAFLLTQTSEATLNDILDAALGADRRKLERFFETLPSPDAMADTVWRAHGADPARSVDTIIAEFCRARDAAEVKRIAEWMRGGTKTDQTRGALLAGVLTMAPGRAMYAAYREFLLTKEGSPRKDPVTKNHSAKHPGLRAIVDDWQAAILVVEAERRAAHAATLAEAALTIADAVRTEYTRAKEARGALDYDDLIVKTRQLLEDRAAAPWVLFKLDGGIDHVLIDEAQDTSPEQWRIVKALTSEFFAGEATERTRGARKYPVIRTIFAVGDEKQSIFSFQGADPAQFDIHRHAFSTAAEAAEQRFVDQPLIVSRRSVKDVLQFVDTVFAPEESRAGLTSGGGPVEHRELRKERGRVELWETVKPADVEDTDPYDLPPVDYVSEASPVAQLARRVADEIVRTIGRVTLPGHKGAVRAGDIMILLPRREPFGTAIIRELKQRGVPVAGADRIRLTEQIAVMDLIALGRFALLADDDHTLAVVLRSPLCGLGEEELFALAHGRDGTLWSELQRRADESASFTAAYDFLSEVRGRADFAPPYEFYAHALIARGMRLRLLKRLGHEATDAIDEFLSLSFAYEASNTPSLEGFLHWIERGGAEIKRDMERARDEVRVMTVHGAKGLEADIVILPDTTSVPTLSNARGNLLYTEDGVLYPVADAEAPESVLAAKAAAKERMLEEHRRLLYVALTRARDRLIVCGFEGKRGIKDGSWYRLAERAATELGIVLTRGDETIRVVGDASDDVQAPPQQEAATPAAERKAWLDTPAPRDAPAPRLVRPFDAAGLDEPATLSPFADNKRFRRGLLVHALLANLPDIPPADRAALAHQFLRMQSIDEADADSLIAETLAVLDDPVFAAAFTPTSRAEIAIVADLPELGPGARVNGRIDRLAVSDDAVLIVDFKTNRPPPTREGDVAPLYTTQMALYRAAASKIFPDKRIACGLVWTEGPTLMKLSNGLLDAEMVRIRARLDPLSVRS
ncbi:MAG TPA: double-strand break repair helicase AddA [Rhizomicrobium sp.]|jgi:ATP-dependent helicase/nuclease subunit A|nr:double-strand break repair helicase AddA [Rhizomicrobium sp.]